MWSLYFIKSTDNWSFESILRLENVQNKKGDIYSSILTVLQVSTEWKYREIQRKVSKITNSN